jgi:hypothetical protein
MTFSVVLLTLAVVGMASTATAGQSAAKNANLEAPDVGFGGYATHTEVSEIGATWRVPRIASNSAIGHASTWVGTDNAAHDFIQLGTVEDMAGNPAEPIYYAFWSDTKKQDLAQPIAYVRPGETLTTDMRQTNSGWHLSLSGPALGHPIQFNVAYARAGHFTRGQWFQEDPISTAPGINYEQYPAMSSVRFTALVLNGRAPNLSFDDSQAMYTPGGAFLVPTEFRRGAFALTAAQGPQSQYLHDLVGMNLASARFGSTFEHTTFRAGLTASQQTEAQNLVTEIHSADAELGAQTWPGAARRSISNLVRHNERMAHDLQTWLSDSTASQMASGLKTFRSDAAGNPKFSDAVRKSLGLPLAR